MISWKYSFERASEELELVKKKKQALDNLFNAGKISQSTYDDLNKSLADAVAEAEARQKALAEKMTNKITELEQQIKTLEMFLAGTEIEYAAGEIDEALHERESGALTIGLEAAKQQLNEIKGTMTDLFPEEAEVVLPPTPAETIGEAGEETLETPVEAPEEATYEQPMEALATEETETLPETPVEEAPTEESFPSPEEPAETLETSETEIAAEEDELVEAVNAEAAEEAPTEEFSSFQGEEETTMKEEEAEE